MSSPDPIAFRFPGAAVGCLLVHGYGGSPAETEALGAHLAAAGFGVVGVRLAGHGGTPAEFHRSRWGQWLDSTLAAYDELRRHHPRIVTVGFSLGGVLGALLSQRRPSAGLVTMGSRVLVAGHWRFTWSPLLRHALAWRDPSLAPLASLRAAVGHAHRALPAVRAPALVMHGRLDTVIAPANAEAIMARLGSPQKELVWWPDTGHQMLVEGPHRQAIYQRIAAFIDGVARAA